MFVLVYTWGTLCGIVSTKSFATDCETILIDSVGQVVNCGELQALYMRPLWGAIPMFVTCSLIGGTTPSACILAMFALHWDVLLVTCVWGGSGTWELQQNVSLIMLSNMPIHLPGKHMQITTWLSQLFGNICNWYGIAFSVHGLQTFASLCKS